MNAVPDPGTRHPSTMTPRQRLRRERLLDAGLRCLDTEDYEQVQVKDIADRAGVSLGTLYSYFSSKERFFAEVLISWAATMPARVKERPPDHASPAECLKSTLHRALRAFESRPHMARLVNVLVMSTDPMAADILARLDRSVSDAYLQALAGIDSALARPIVDVLQSVFAVELREWSLGRKTLNEVHRRLDVTIDLLVPGAPTVSPRTR